jgi:hypothetical protein
MRQLRAMVTTSRFDGWSWVAVAGELDATTSHERASVLQTFTDQSVGVHL